MDKYLLLREPGYDCKPVQAKYISNGSFSDVELTMWIKSMKESKRALPTQQDAEKMAREMKLAEDYVLKDEDAIAVRFN